MCVFITLNDSLLLKREGEICFWCVIVELKSEKVGHGSNIPAAVVGDYRCKDSLPSQGKGGCN